MLGIIFSRTIVTVFVNNLSPQPIDTVPPPPVIVREYGLPVDSFIIVKGTVNPNQNISEIFSKYKIPSSVLNNIITNYDTIFDAKKIKSGNNYKVFLSKDKEPVAKYFVYEKSPIEYLLFSLSDTINFIKNKKDITYQRKAVLIKINTSLWNAMTENNINPELTSQLENIFQWTIDFFGLQKGDYFRLIYEEQYVDSHFIGYGKVFASCFHSENKDIYAIPFVQDDVENYYDEHGVSLKKAFLKAPLRFSRISSGYSNSRLHPILKIRRPHHGIDYSAPSGTPVFSIGEGKVIYSGWSGGGGKTVKIQHNSVYASLYMHLSNYAKGINKGSHVSQGQIIGYVGSTGLATGPHLDFRISKNNSYVNPLNIQSPPTEPVRNKNKIDFYIIKNKLVKELNEIK